MLNTKTKSFPNGIANSSGVLGHYLMDHNYNAGASGQVEGFDNEYYSGRRPTGPYIPNFRFKPSLYAKGFLRGYALSGGAGRSDWRGDRHKDGIGTDFKDKLTKPGNWHFGLHAQGEMLPRFENQISLPPTKKDKWGIPQLDIDCTWSNNEILMMEDAAEQAEKMLVKAGVKDVKSYTSTHRNNPGLAIHEVGTARMGADPKQSVLNKYNQSHDIANLFVTDGSSFCSSAVVNPSLTFMALTVRAVDYCVKEMNAKRI
jgi:choline dehydrogenase-like flavoprotein